MSKLVDYLVSEGNLKSDSIIAAFNKVKRVDFLPEDLVSQADNNRAIPIGHGQTNSQPLTVAFMLEKLVPEEGQNILDIGSGSGWTTALLASIVERSGKVVAIERLKSLFETGKNNISKYDFIKNGIVEVYVGDGRKGYPRHAPYDRILVSATSENVPDELLDQLKVGGIMVIPIEDSIWKIEKKEKGEFIRKEYTGFSFVPLVE